MFVAKSFDHFSYAKMLWSIYLNFIEIKQAQHPLMCLQSQAELSLSLSGWPVHGPYLQTAENYMAQL